VAARMEVGALTPMKREWQLPTKRIYNLQMKGSMPIAIKWEETVRLARTPKQRTGIPMTVVIHEPSKSACGGSETPRKTKREGLRRCERPAVALRGCLTMPALC
jgi:hypothetical protein